MSVFKKIAVALLVAIFSLFTSSPLVFADSLPTCGCCYPVNVATENFANCLNDGKPAICENGHGGSIEKIVTIVVNTMVELVCVLAVVGMIIAGYQYMSSSGDPSKVTLAKKRIVQTSIGLVTFALLGVGLNFLIPGGVFNSHVDESYDPSEKEVCATPPTMPDHGGTNSTTPGTTPGTPSSSPLIIDECNAPGADTSTYTPGIAEHKMSGSSYYLYVPDNAKKCEKRPLVMFLHGSAVWGGSITKIDKYAFVKYIKKQGRKYEFFMYAPHATSTGFSKTHVMNTAKEIIANYNINPKKVVIVGNSGGSKTTVGIIGSGKYDGFFSAVGLTAYGPSGNGTKEAEYFRNIPTWVLYGKKDSKSGNSSAAKAFRNKLVEINPNAKITEFPDLAHDCLDASLSDDQVVYWLLSW